ncbi:protein kinase domain-containing protein [Trebonia kvetii]|uniref:protein kinase domain-containing protein n=1 Tax=Trebonia kvetii TaxID=2480626 RepID=UPI001651BE41|nr:protein kinase [Trebonia kvetii]
MAGTTVLGGRYKLLAVLGTGGMATVWRARDEMLSRDVAVKVLNPQHAADAEFLDRFEGEARHAAAVSHPRLVTVFDCGVESGTPFIVMELVAGRTLRQVLDEAGMLPPGRAVAIAAAVCEGLEAAHAAGLVHRDITPANIVLNGGEVKVLDFGIARADGTRAATAAGTVLGTVAYLSPEQASGRPADPRSDLYSLGCVLFEMLTGRPPFTADSAVGLAYRQVHDDPGLPSAWRPGLPASLDQVIARLLAKDPSSRPPTAAAARAGLLSVFSPADGVQNGGTAVLPVTPGTVPGTPRRGWRPRPSEAALGAALAASLIALMVVLLTGGQGGGHPVTASGSPPASLAARPAATGTGSSPAQPETTLSPVAAAAATLVGDLKEGVTDGQVAPQAGQNLFNQLQQLLFQSPGQNPQQVQQQYSQLVQVFTQDKSKGQVTGQAATSLSSAISALGAALGTL